MHAIITIVGLCVIVGILAADARQQDPDFGLPAPKHPSWQTWASLGIVAAALIGSWVL